MKEKTLAFCRKIYLAVKQYDKDEDDDEYENITIVDSVEGMALRATNAIKEKLSNELPSLRGEARVQLLYRMIDELPLRCNSCGHIVTQLHGSQTETRTDINHGYSHTSVWTHESGDYPAYLDEITNTDDGDSDTDDFNVGCVECGENYDTDEWTIAVPRDLADTIFAAASLVSGKKPKVTVTTKKPAIFNQFSEIKHRPQLDMEAFDEGSEGVGVPFGESMEKLLV